MIERLGLHYCTSFTCNWLFDIPNMEWYLINERQRGTNKTFVLQSHWFSLMVFNVMNSFCRICFKWFMWNRDLLLQPNTKILVFEGGKNNLPDEDSFKASRAIEELVRGRKNTDLIIVLVSGRNSCTLSFSLTHSLSLNPLTFQVTRLKEKGQNMWSLDKNMHKIY